MIDQTIKTAEQPLPQKREWCILVNIEYGKFLKEGEDPVDVYKKLEKLKELNQSGITFKKCYPTSNKE